MWLSKSGMEHSWVLVAEWFRTGACKPVGRFHSCLRWIKKVKFSSESRVGWSRWSLAGNQGFHRTDLLDPVKSFSEKSLQKIL